MEFSESARKANGAIIAILRGTLREKLPIPSWSDFDSFHKVQQGIISTYRVIEPTPENGLTGSITVLKRDFTFYVFNDVVAIITVEGFRREGNVTVHWSVCRVQYLTAWHRQGRNGMWFVQPIETTTSRIYPEDLSPDEVLARLST